MQSIKNDWNKITTISRIFNHYQKPIKFTNPDVECDYNRNTFFYCIAKVSIGCRADTKKRNMELFGIEKENDEDDDSKY